MKTMPIVVSFVVASIICIAPSLNAGMVSAQMVNPNMMNMMGGMMMNPNMTSHMWR